jgi:hypothetical protein
VGTSRFAELLGLLKLPKWLDILDVHKRVMELMSQMLLKLPQLSN